MQTYTGGCHCGPRLDPTSFMVNVRCLDGIDPSVLDVVQFDGRSWAADPNAPYTGTWRPARA